MDNVQLLKNMQKQHKQIANDLDELESLSFIISTEAGTEANKKLYNKKYNKVNKNLNTLLLSYKLIQNQKLNLPPEFAKIGIEIKEFKNRVQLLKK